MPPWTPLECPRTSGRFLDPLNQAGGGPGMALAVLGSLPEHLNREKPNATGANKPIRLKGCAVPDQQF